MTSWMPWLVTWTLLLLIIGVLFDLRRRAIPLHDARNITHQVKLSVVRGEKVVDRIEALERRNPQPRQP